jgi:hypothetical protein
MPHPGHQGKLFKKLFKYTVFFILSFIVANFLLAYIIGMDELLKIISEPPSEHLQGLTAITMFSLFFTGYSLIQGTGMYNCLSLRQTAGCTA